MGRNNSGSMGRTVLEKYEDEVGTHCAIHSGNVSTDGAVAILTKDVVDADEQISSKSMRLG